MAKARTTTGTTFLLGSTDYPIDKVSVSHEGHENAVVDATHLASTTVEKIVDELTDGGRLTFETSIDPDALVTLKTAMGVAQTGTLTFKTTAGETAGAKMEGNCAVVSHSFDGPVREKISGSFTVEWLDEITFTAATST